VASQALQGPVRGFAVAPRPLAHVPTRGGLEHRRGAVTMDADASMDRQGGGLAESNLGRFAAGGLRAHSRTVAVDVDCIDGL